MRSCISKTLFRRCPLRWRRFCSCSVWGRSTTACSSSWTRLPSTCSASVVSGRTLSKQVKKLALAIFFDPVLALDCHADQTGCWRFFLKLSIKLMLKLFWVDTEALRLKHAVSKWGRGLIAVGCSLNHTAWTPACVAGSSWKPTTPCLTTCWKSLKRRLVISCLKSGYQILAQWYLVQGQCWVSDAIFILYLDISSSVQSPTSPGELPTSSLCASLCTSVVSSRWVELLKVEMGRSLPASYFGLLENKLS